MRTIGGKVSRSSLFPTGKWAGSVIGTDGAGTASKSGRRRDGVLSQTRPGPRPQPDAAGTASSLSRCGAVGVPLGRTLAFGPPGLSLARALRRSAIHGSACRLRRPVGRRRPLRSPGAMRGARAEGRGGTRGLSAPTRPGPRPQPDEAGTSSSARRGQDSVLNPTRLGPRPQQPDAGGTSSSASVRLRPSWRRGRPRRRW